MNVVVLMGRLTGDPNLSKTPNDTSVTNFSVAVDRGYTNSDGERMSDFINVTAWRGTAEFIAKYFKKGNRIAIRGSLQTRRYTDKDGNKRTITEVLAEQAFFCESASTGNTREETPSAGAKKTKKAEEPAGEISTDEELPF